VRHLDLGALAGAVAFALVALNAAAVPTLPPERAAWLDAVLNEWIVWFTAIYLALVGISAIAARTLPQRSRITE
jgi:hypothetical protein